MNGKRARVFLAVASMLIAGSAWAQMPDGGSGPGMMHRPPIERAFVGHGIEGRWWNNPKVIDRLKLTDEQRKEFDNILLQHREKLIDLHANVDKAELEMEPLVRADQPNEAQILAQIDKVAQARAELEKANARYLLALRGKLTPEQWKLVQEFRENHMMRQGEWGRNRQGGGGGMRRGPRPGGDGPDHAPPPPDGGQQAAPPPGGPGGSGDIQ
ncbi:MAG TPA: Spy/CpxP family protein refolding chaperone [Terracidiphilus sp.]|nr:Spy/CpxP family protein refolding chaperone [Terracidiphilus sp.]